MADISLTVTLLDVNVTQAVNAFLKIHPNVETKPKDGEVPDENGEYTPDQLEPKYANSKLWAEEILRRHLWLILRKGHKQIQKEAETALGDRGDFIS